MQMRPSWLILTVQFYCISVCSGQYFDFPFGRIIDPYALPCLQQYAVSMRQCEDKVPTTGLQQENKVDFHCFTIKINCIMCKVIYMLINYSFFSSRHVFALYKILFINFPQQFVYKS